MHLTQVNLVGVGVAIGIGVEKDLFDTDPDTDPDPEEVGLRFTINLREVLNQKTSSSPFLFQEEAQNQMPKKKAVVAGGSWKEL